MKYQRTFFNLASFLLASAIIFFARNELLITFGLIIFIIIAFKIKYFKGEWKILIFGVLTGIFIEFVGSYFYKLQYWEEASLPFGLPIWLPIFWGIGFIFIRRIGELLLKEK